MSSLKRLVAGELKRLVRYKILPVSLATAILWIVLLLFLSESEAREAAPLIIFIDVAVMSILLLGASHHLEKQEGTIRSMLVMPVSPGQILAAKTISSMVLAVESVIITSVHVCSVREESYFF
jgi:fluoroquinolone transport system permease protein